MNSYGEKYTNGLPGRNWNVLSLEFNDEIIAEMEQDVIEMIRCFNTAPEKIIDSWLFNSSAASVNPIKLAVKELQKQVDENSIFKYVDILPLGDDAMESWRAFLKKLKETDSWILQVTSSFVRAVTRDFLSLFHFGLTSAQNENTGEELTRVTVYDELVEEGIRKAQTAKENELILVIMECLPSLLRASFEGLEEFLSDNVAEVIESSCYGVSFQMESWTNLDSVELIKSIRNTMGVGIETAKKLVDKILDDGFFMFEANLSYVDAEIVRESFMGTDVSVSLRVCNIQKALEVFETKPVQTLKSDVIEIKSAKELEKEPEEEQEVVSVSLSLDGNCVNVAVQTFVRSEAQLWPKKISNIRRCEEESFFYDEVKEVSLDVSEFASRKNKFVQNTAKERHAHQKAVSQYNESQNQKAEEKYNRKIEKEVRKDRRRKTFKIFAIIMAIVVALAGLLQLFVKVDTETCVVIAMVIAVIIAVIMKLTDRGGFIVSFIVSYIILGIVFAGASAGAKALLIRDVEELYTPEIVKNYESEEGKKLAITECTEDGRVTAYWTWDFENGSYGRVQLIGHIGEKKSNGDITIYWDSQTVASLSEGLKWNDESWLKISDNYTKIVTDTEVEFRATD